jgi:hypothetical protein
MHFYGQVVNTSRLPPVDPTPPKSSLFCSYELGEHFLVGTTPPQQLWGANMGLKVWGCIFENPCHLAISRDPMMVGGQKFGHKDYTSYP